MIVINEWFALQIDLAVAEGEAEGYTVAHRTLAHSQQWPRTVHLMRRNPNFNENPNPSDSVRIDCSIDSHLQLCITAIRSGSPTPIPIVPLSPNQPIRRSFARFFTQQ